MMAQKAEYMAASGPDLRAVSPGSACNPAQLRNISLCNCLQVCGVGAGWWWVVVVGGRGRRPLRGEQGAQAQPACAWHTVARPQQVQARGAC